MPKEVVIADADKGREGFRRRIFFRSSRVSEERRDGGGLGDG